MNSSQIDFPSRVSVRAIAAGSISAAGVMILFASLAAALGLWKLELSELPNAGGGFWTLALIGWIASMFVGGYVAAITSRSSEVRDGFLHAFVVWASTCISGCLILFVATGRFLGGITPTTTGMYWGMFLGDLLAIGAAFLGGYKGVSAEKSLEAYEQKERGPRKAA